jgi:serine protease
LRSIDTSTNAGLTTPGANIYTNEINPNLGTSFSAPIVTGIAALMRAVNGNLTPAQLIARIQRVERGQRRAQSDRGHCRGQRDRGVRCQRQRGGL